MEKLKQKIEKENERVFLELKNLEEKKNKPIRNLRIILLILLVGWFILLCFNSALDIIQQKAFHNYIFLGLLVSLFTAEFVVNKLLFRKLNRRIKRKRNFLNSICQKNAVEFYLNRTINQLRWFISEEKLKNLLEKSMEGMIWYDESGFNPSGPNMKRDYRGYRFDFDQKGLENYHLTCLLDSADGISVSFYITV